MFRMRRTPLLLVAAGALLAACSAETRSDGKEIADLRAQLQRAQNDGEKHRERIAVLERRLAGLSEDMARVGKTTAEVAAAVAPKDEAAAANAAAAPAPAAGVVVVDAPAMKTYFESEEGRKAFAAALKYAQEQSTQEQLTRGVDTVIARLTKEANLTEDQSKRMKEILSRGAAQLRDLMQSMRDGGAAADGGDVRQKFADLRTSTDNEARAVLSQSQFESYQKIVPTAAAIGGFGGFGGRPRGTGGGGGFGN
jgi:DNA anti-recombination protein RmuC